MKAQTTLAHYPDGTQFSRVDARLSWTDDDRLVLERIDRAGAAVETLFDAPVSRVRVTGGMSTPKFTVEGRGYRVDFAERARIDAMITGAAAGIVGSDAGRGASVGMYAGGTAASGVEQWVGALKASGASTSYWTTAKITGVTLAAVGGLVVLIFVALIIGSVASATGALR